MNDLAARSPNMGLQRTAPCGRAAELRSFGGRFTVAVLIAAILALLPAGIRAEPKVVPSPLIPGLYENFRYVEDAGDVVGMGVFIVWSSTGLHSNFNALVQTAEGMPGEPALTPVTVRGSHVEFWVPQGELPPLFFRGDVSKTSLVGTLGDEKVKLKRVHRGFGW